MMETINIARKQEVLSLVTNITFSNVPCWYDATRRDLHMDLIIPKQRNGHTPCPVIVWICGGAYMVVDHAVWMPEMVRFARAGYVVASIEYRTTNEASFPAQLIDVKSAIRYLRAHAREYCLDPDRIFVMGESAGGTMACLLGTTGNMTEYDQGDHLTFSSRVQGVVDFYGLTDMDPNARISGGAVPYWTMDAFLGGADAAGMAYKASAVNHVSCDTPPFMILHGSEDPVVPLEQSRRLYDTLVRNGVPAEFLILEGATHGDDRFYQDEMVERIMAFFNKIP